VTRLSEREDMPVYEDDARAVALINEYIRDGHAMRPPNLPDKTTISARLSRTAHHGLQQIAKELGYVHGRSGKGNVSLLLEAIGTRTVTVTQMPLQARHL
jgi:hypothetical protein